jgi:hypothetical protein
MTHSCSTVFHIYLYAYIAIQLYYAATTRWRSTRWYNVAILNAAQGLFQLHSMYLAFNQEVILPRPRSFYLSILIPMMRIICPNQGGNNSKWGPGIPRCHVYFPRTNTYKSSQLLLNLLYSIISTSNCGMAKAIIMCVHIQQERGNGCTTKVCIIDRKQHVEVREKDCQQLPVVVFWLPPPAVM